MKRLLFNLLAGLSLLLFLGTFWIAFEFRDISRHNKWNLQTTDGAYGIYVESGMLQFCTYKTGDIVEIPLFFLVALLAVLPTIWLDTEMRNRWRKWQHGRIVDRQGRCTTCGYDLRATTDRCPECGTVPLKKVEGPA